MLVTIPLFYVLSMLTGAAGFGTAFFLLRKKVGPGIATLGAIVAGAALYSVFLVTSNRVLVVEESLHVKNYYVFGSFSEQLANGKTIRGTFRNNRFGVLNRSGKNIVVEEITYKHASNASETTLTGDYLIPAYSYREIFLPQNEITYYFDDTIPEKLQSGYSSESKYWLHPVGEDLTEF